MTRKQKGRPAKVTTPHGDVSITVDGPRSAEALLLLAPGAGSNMHSDFLSFVADGLASEGIRVCRFNFVYSEVGRKAPDRHSVLEETYRAVADHAREGWAGRVFLGGKSMGGRIGSHVVAEGYDVDGLVFFGYPLHPPGRPEKLRDEHLYQVKPPMLFIEGSRDPFCPLPTLEKVRKKLPGLSEVAVIDGGDHSFKIRKASGRTTADAWTEVGERAAAWMSDPPD
ncbi:MAG: alpha/beta hydrolase family protein [Actinomycetota bacterium]